MAKSLTDMSPAERQQYFASVVRIQDGKQYNNINGQWVEVPYGSPLPPQRGSGSNVSFGGGGPGSGGIGVSLPLFGAGAERPTTPGGGATGPGGATFRPGTPTPPIAGSGLPTTSFGTPATPAPDTSLPSLATPTPTPTSATTTVPPLNTGSTGGGTTQAILDALQKYGPLIAAGGKIATSVALGRQAGRTAEQNAANQTNTANILRNNSALQGVSSDILQRNYLGTNYDRNVDNAVRGGYMQGVEDLNIPRPEGVPSRHITGGLRPSAFTNRKDVGAAMEKEAMTELLDPTRMASDPRPATKRLPALPELPALQEVEGPGTLDAILSSLGYASAAGPLIDALLKANTPAPATPTVNDLPITPPDPLIVTAPDIDLGNAPLDPNADTRTQGLIDTLGRRRTGRGAYFGDPRF